MLAEGAAGADGLIGAPIGAPVCAQTGAAIARAAAIVTPFNRCFMPLPLITLGMGRMRCEGCVIWQGPLPGLGPETTSLLRRSREHARRGIRVSDLATRE